MNNLRRIILLFALCLLPILATTRADEPARLRELDAYWNEVARCVKDGDFSGYEATTHPDGALVTGIKKQSHPLPHALARWKKEFDDTKAGTRKSHLTLRFSQRIGDATTAHETGIFLYEATLPDGTAVKEYIHFEALLLKRDRWKIVMEYQKAAATEAEWNALAK